jgi:hypothetical protein
LRIDLHKPCKLLRVVAQVVIELGHDDAAKEGGESEAADTLPDDNPECRAYDQASTKILAKH